MKDQCKKKKKRFCEIYVLNVNYLHNYLHNLHLGIFIQIKITHLFTLIWLHLFRYIISSFVSRNIIEKRYVGQRISISLKCDIDPYCIIPQLIYFSISIEHLHSCLKCDFIEYFKTLYVLIYGQYIVISLSLVINNQWDNQNAYIIWFIASSYNSNEYYSSISNI